MSLTIAFTSLAALLLVRTRSRRAITLGLMAALLSLSLVAPAAQAAERGDPARSAAGAIDGVGDRVAERRINSDELGREAIATARNFAIPLALALIVLAFLVIQALVDRRDPRLIHVPATDDEDMVGFE